MRTRIYIILSAAVLTCMRLPRTSAEVNTKPVAAAQDNSAAGDKEWQELLKASRPPNPPAEWNNHTPSAAELADFAKKRAELAGQVAVKAKEFYTKYPDHPKAIEAKQKEQEFKQLADSQKPAPPADANDAKFIDRVRAVQKAAMDRHTEGMEVMMAQFESGVRDLMKEFPDRSEVYDLLYSVAANSPAEKTRALVKEIASSKASDRTKDAASALLKKMDLLGHPLDLKFTALDGREVDLGKMVGKVVLVDFWATWCGPCIGELPHVKEAYSNLHDKGFEIVSISFDQSKEKLESFIKKEKMEWPQYFDGEGWGNKIGKVYGINAIPSMWLVDKKGKVRDLNARDDLAGKVERMLAEF
ncbi:MAG: resA 1 [Verrucomicrobiales bacterium]|nr:resA 1 [Verrucomicrobiales bacterium]